MIRMKPQPYSGVFDFELSLDPWHADAFVGTPGEGVVGSGGKRREVWLALDHWKNPVGVMELKEGYVPYYDKDKKTWYWKRKPKEAHRG